MLIPYTLNFGKLARIASNPLGGTFLPQSKKTRLNRICTDTQIVMKRHIMAYDATSNLTLCIRRILFACFLAASIPLSILNTNSVYYVSYTSLRPGIGRTSVVILKEKSNSSNIFCGLQTTCFQYSHKKTPVPSREYWSFLLKVLER